ncbi:TonB-dependent receptor plug domain-containing protein [uncultured Aquimarina sp.]|uniref:TonB-dependent receptor plug domain-containing protein n=1 Tax=uncultured Aquimarina sp. TaxID=575652 RepID=UPI0026313C50|nr:TonB-dependent receptor plug domain-containing protein [uncultured Aquimarina sp.]
MKQSYILIGVLFSSLLFFNTSFANISKEKDIVIYWDASLSQKNKDINKELEFLDAFFQTFPNSKVKLVVFNTLITFKGDFDVKTGNWNPIKSQLQKVTYDSAASFSLVDTKVQGDMLLLFSDGKSYLQDLKSSLYSPRIITVSNQKDIDKKFLYETAFYNRGYYVNLLESNIVESVKAIKEEKILPRLKFVSKIDTDKNYIKGTVLDEKGILSGVSVTIVNKDITTITAEDGSYTIQADPGDVLLFNYVSKKKISIEIGNEKLIDVQMLDAGNVLETVFIKSNKSDDGQEKVIIGDRMVDKRSLGYDVQNISADEISDDEFTLGSAMAGKFAGVKMGNNNDAGQMQIRGGFGSFVLTNYPLFVIDGVPIPRSSITSSANMDFIDPNNIADITVLKGLAATNRYGSLGSSGVVIVTTKSGKSKYTPKKKEEEKLVIDYKIFKDNLVVENLPVSNYIKRLETFTSTEETYNHYLSLQPTKLDDVNFFVESASYFFDEGASDMGIQILSNLVELFPNDTSILKIVAFTFEKYQLYDNAQEIYTRIIKVSPSLSQTYFDVAKNYAQGKESQNSIDQFNKIVNRKIKEIPSFSGLNDQISNDFKLLLSKRNQGWKTENIPSKYFVLPKYDVRVVVEWSHPQTEYELQYINPKKQYFNLSHTLEQNKKTLLKELKGGYNSEEFVLSETDKGEWFLNLIVPDNYKPDSKAPKFVRIKVYSNFGRQNVKLTTHLINLDTINRNIIFTSFKI